MSHTITTRQYIALRLYYVEGWSYRRIGKLFGSNPGTTYRLVQRGKRCVIECAAEEGGNGSPKVRGLLAPSPTSSITCNVGIAASRQDELYDALELLMQQHAMQATAFAECMSDNSFHSTHIKRNNLDQWEMRSTPWRRHCLQIPTSAYEARSALGLLQACRLHLSIPVRVVTTCAAPAPRHAPRREASVARLALTTTRQSSASVAPLPSLPSSPSMASRLQAVTWQRGARSAGRSRRAG